MTTRRLLALLLLMPGVLLALDSVENELLGIYGSEEFISIATGYKQPLSRAPAVASIFTAEDIRRAGATDLDHILEMVPGLHVSRSYQGYNPIYAVRGIYSTFNPQLLLLINGIPQTNLFTGGRNFVWGGMPVEAIERVEVIRGPGSAVYGADAFAGVVNIITRSAASYTGVEAGVHFGSDSTRNGHLLYGNRWGESGLLVALELGATRGDDSRIASDAQTVLDQLTGTNASLAPGSVNRVRENVDLRLDYRFRDLVLRAGYQGRRVGTGAGVAQALDPYGRYSSDRWSLDAGYTIDELWWEDLSVNLSASFLDVSQNVDRDSMLFPPGSTGPFLDAMGQPLFPPFTDGVVGNPEVYERHLRINGSFHYQGIDRHDLSLGLGYHHGDLHRVREQKNFCSDAASCEYILPRGGVVEVSGTPFVFLTEGSRDNYYVYIQDIFHVANDWELTAGVRYDHFSDFGSTLNPRFSLVWATSHRLTTKLLYGEAFRAPSFQETRVINNPAALGNPNLKPETLRSLELVFDHRYLHSLATVFNLFYYKWEDIIQFVPDPVAGTATASNAGRQDGYGFELETRWAAHRDIDLHAGLSWQRSENKRTGRRAANTPSTQLRLQGNWRVGELYELHGQLRWVADRARESGDPRATIDDYTLVDIGIRRRNLWQAVDMNIIVRNLFNADAREPSPNGLPVPLIADDLPLPGRQVFAEFRYQF